MHLKDRRVPLVPDEPGGDHPLRISALYSARSFVARGQLFACSLFVISGFHTVHAADLKQTAAFGDWAQYCEAATPQSTGECALVQNVSGDLKADPRVWVKSSGELTKAQKLILTLRFDRSIKTESGVGLSIDNQSIGVSSFFECDVKSCKSSLELGSKYSRNDFGQALDRGKTLSVDLKADEDSGYSLPINLVGLQEGISALTAQSADPAWLLSGNPKANTPSFPLALAPGALTGSSPKTGFITGSSPKVAFNVEFVRQLNTEEFVDGALAAMRSKDAGLDFRNFVSEGCSGSVSQMNGLPPVVPSTQPGLKTVVTFNSDMAVSKEDIDRLKTLYEKSKRCGEKRGYFSVALDPESLAAEKGRPTSGHDWAAYGSWGILDLEWRKRVHSELFRAMNEAGISREKVMVDSRWAISPVLMLDTVPPLVNAR
jgi:invasion protein IalB